MDPESGLALSEIGQIAVPVTEVERAEEFYRETLGMRFLFRAPPGLAFFDCAGVRLMLATEEPGAERRSPVIYYRVADLPTAVATLKDRGVVMEAEPRLIARMPDHELWMAFFRDPDRNLLGLMSEVR
jgi:methylmalonyl-CoA/ethylmalonyl-CoA epimerase